MVASVPFIRSEATNTVRLVLQEMRQSTGFSVRELLKNKNVRLFLKKLVLKQFYSVCLRKRDNLGVALKYECGEYGFMWTYYPVRHFN